MDGKSIELSFESHIDSSSHRVARVSWLELGLVYMVNLGLGLVVKVRLRSQTGLKLVLTCV